MVDTYFRQMGEAAWLSRDKEIALAKRIEASQQAMLAILCGVPMIVERIACWGREVIEGRFRLTELFEMPLFGMAPAASGLTDAVAGSESGDAETLARAEAGEAWVTSTRLRTIIALSDEIGSLSRKRLTAVLRRRDLTKSNRTRLQELKFKLADELAAIRLRADRLSDLIDELEREERLHRRIAQPSLEIAHRAGVPLRRPRPPAGLARPLVRLLGPAAIRNRGCMIGAQAAQNLCASMIDF